MGDQVTAAEDKPLGTCVFPWADDENLTNGKANPANLEMMKYWNTGFDRTRFCRSDAHTYKKPTCCNFV